MKKPIDIQLTKDGLRKLRDEFQALTQKRPEVLKRLVAAREQGDLSENAGYHAAKDELSTIDRRLRELKIIFRFAEVIEPKRTDSVTFGSQVTLKNGLETQEFTIVGALEADPSQNKLSNVSPIGSVLIGKSSGETIAINVPQGKVTYKIINIK